MGPEKIRAIIYDFDDTIVESERINDALFSDLLRNDYSLDLSPEELDVLYGFSWSGVFEWLARNRGFRRSMKDVWVTFLQKKRNYLQGSRLRVARGFNRMLSLPVRQAIVSGSTRAEIDVMMENIRMPADSVDLILSDEDCEKGKPDPEGYLRALDLLDAPASEALVFEDSPAGMEAARRAGISVAFVAELASRNNAALADLRFADFEEAYPWVRARIETAASRLQPPRALWPGTPE
jgi:beta-phosphoglucomutase-like phosphatase (HAD superfamily)